MHSTPDSNLFSYRHTVSYDTQEGP
jgi:hypothetical protein